MADYRAPLRDINFVLFETFEADRLWANTKRLAEVVDKETAGAILDEGAKITNELVAPLNRSGDEEGAKWDNGKVTTPAGFKAAYTTYAEGGWVGLAGDPQHGGMGMPKMLAVQFEEMMYGANNSFTLYPTLSAGACLAINYHASEELQSFYLPKVYSGEWSATMCLTEPHSGTDLGILKTKAEPQADDSYLITGTKIFITGGDHDLTDNIVHLVLARLPGAPEGPRGISLFITPKYLPTADGGVGDYNNVSCGSIEHKMGIKASATCVLNFDQAKGWLVGEEGKGLNAMFTMMNFERLSIGIQGIGCSEASYQTALEYARERLQGRAATGKANPEGVADPILNHADIRRMLLNIKSTTEAGRAFSTYVARYLDLAKYSDDEDERQRSADLVALLTPVAKAFFTDMGLNNTVDGQQVFGGHGYIREWGQEQLVRDVRIAQIYEGTNGVQALDLMGRKTVVNNGAFFKLFAEEIREFIASNNDEGLSEFTKPLSVALDSLEELTQWVITQAQDNRNEIGSASLEYLHVFGYVAYAYMWAKMSKAALVALGSDTQESDYYEAKLSTSRYFYGRMLPRTLGLTASIKSGADLLFALDDKQFG